MASGQAGWPCLSPPRDYATGALPAWGDPGTPASWSFRGPYRFLTHPNYVAVALELLNVPLIFDAWISSLVAMALNATLLLGMRIPTEEKALQLLEKRY